MMHTITITEEQRQMTLLALATLSLERPGFHMALSETAAQFSGVEMFEEFRRVNADRFPSGAPLGPGVGS